MASRTACLIISASIVACSSAPAPDPQPKDTTPAYFAVAAGQAAPMPTRPAPKGASGDPAAVAMATPTTGPETEASAPTTAAVGEVTVPELIKMLADKSATAIDANNDSTRRQLGVIPGAVRLSSFSSFAESELPADKSKTLVFYCTNPSCESAPNAAKTAASAGYVDVRVLSAGVTGWAKAGHPVDR